MIPTDIVPLVAQFGIAGPLVGILIYLLKSTNEERREITKDFLSTLESMVKANTEATTGTASALAMLNSSIRDTSAANSAEHQQMIGLLRELLAANGLPVKPKSTG